MRYTRYCRSILCTPASAPHRYGSSHRSGADICMVDLEDSVAAGDKEKARVQAEEFFTMPSPVAPDRKAVRINAVVEPDGLRDLLAIARYPVKPAIVLIPKVESARDVEVVAQVLGPVCPGLQLHAVIETARGLEHVGAIAAASRNLRALIFGSADYSFDVGAHLSWQPLMHSRAALVNGARAADIHAIDSPWFRFSDTAGLRREARMASEWGFSGKIAIHPEQVPVINAAFSPDPQTLEHARRVVEAARASGHGATAVDGMMLGTPFFDAARRLIEEFGPGEEPRAASGERR